ncbi:thioredoxin-dependent thiol peroxidase [Candidatus Gracilibacteria bacterium]|nr:thioredoxin-dependent thiol peroxidase [Candidatus Gracilibacteria bacterium]
MAEAPMVGALAPEFTAITDGGETVKLADFRGKKVILYFYPKDDTPGCTSQACGFRDAYLLIEEKNAVVLGVSPDGQKSHAKFRTKHNLPFTLLVDEDHSIAEAYGVWGEKSMMGRKYMGVIRSHFVIDAEGRIVQAELKVSPADSVQRAIAAIGEGPLHGRYAPQNTSRRVQRTAPFCLYSAPLKTAVATLIPGCGGPGTYAQCR